MAAARSPPKGGPLASEGGLSPRRRRRFRREELTCFKRLPSPSPLCDWKAEVYWQCTGQHRQSTSSTGLHALPLGKGRFYSAPGRGLSLPELVQFDSEASAAPEERREEEAAALPGEGPTARVLDRIFPRSSAAVQEEEEARRREQGRLGRGRRGAVLHRHAQQDSLSFLAGQLRGRKAEPKAAKQATDLVAFRQMILDKFPTVTRAFDVFVADGGGDEGRELSRWEFCRFLSRHVGGLSREEHVQIFDFIDADRSGSVSMKEFQTVVEAAAPVRTMEDLRRKLVALGWRSMRQVLQQMERGTGGAKRLGLHEFATLLQRVGVREDSEHQNLFAAIVDRDGDAGTVSINELSAALSAVSPSLLLEDIRNKLTTQYASLGQAFAAIDLNVSGSVDLHEFTRCAMQQWRMSFYEAERAFSLIDTNRNRSITRQEFESALQLAEPSLALEEIRCKVRQRWRSIMETLQVEAMRLADSNENRRSSLQAALEAHDGGMTGVEAQELFSALAGAGFEGATRARSKTAPQLQKLLEKVMLAEAETKALFELMDTDRDGSLSAEEFERGIRLFAPSVVLEDLMCACMRAGEKISEAFQAVPLAKRHTSLDAEGLWKVLERLNLAQGINVKAIVDLVTPNRDGGVTVSELIAALQSACPGAQVRLGTAQRNAAAREKVHSTMAPFRKGATELRAHVRMRAPTETDAPILLGSFDELRAQESIEAAAMRRHANMEDPQPKARRQVDTPPGNVKSSYSKVRACLEEAQAPVFLERVKGYYASAGKAALKDGKLLERQHSRFRSFVSATGHQEVLRRSCER